MNDEEANDNSSEVRVAGGPTGRLMLWVPYSVARARLRRNQTDLPRRSVSERDAVFELPALASDELKTDREVIELYDNDGCPLRHIELALATSTLSRRKDKASPEDVEKSSDANELADDVERLLAFHIERCNELLFPTSGGAISQARRLNGLTRSDWRYARKVYWRADDEEGPLRIIVRIAETCAPLLQSVCERPRRALRRVREASRFDRVQQMDDACIRWLIRRPGRTLLEKAGPERKVLAVQRIETTDTPENRVIRDFLERAVRECTGYLREHGQRRESPRVRLIRKFRRWLIRWLTTTQIGDVPRPVGFPRPNYVLQFDERYAPLWFWYERLRRQQTGVDEAWRWRRRIFVEHCRLALAECLSPLESKPTILKRLYLTIDHNRGSFLDEQSTLGPWIAGSRGRLVYLLGSEELSNAASILELPPGTISSIADFMLVEVDAHASSAGSRQLGAVFAELYERGHDPRAAEYLAMETGGHLDRIGIGPELPIAVLLGIGSGNEEPQIWQSRTNGGRRCIGVAMPMPPTPRSCDLGAVVEHFEM
ncbi:MAG: DUF2357 domain-containing protein [Planctomycetes bacterium]|nr:DUF2357 domain-containing protein [Planctomycetota bacterium]NOG53206.1 DUF2357 domain-containing protein [Planctomycetota bacterium]